MILPVCYLLRRSASSAARSRSSVASSLLISRFSKAVCSTISGFSGSLLCHFCNETAASRPSASSACTSPLADWTGKYSIDFPNRSIAVLNFRSLTAMNPRTTLMAALIRVTGLPASSILSSIPRSWRDSFCASSSLPSSKSAFVTRRTSLTDAIVFFVRPDASSSSCARVTFRSLSQLASPPASSVFLSERDKRDAATPLISRLTCEIFDARILYCQKPSTSPSSSSLSSRINSM
mmetsp:Transcript_28540/g.111753  ORF Transcript_28540/g.111753 Transcript_28540/m.111753 type:complete len:236 (-) Transcript_28540:984-1691(-)